MVLLTFGVNDTLLVGAEKGGGYGLVINGRVLGQGNA